MTRSLTALRGALGAALLAACGSLAAHGGQATGDLRERIAEVRAATAPFADVQAALTAGYAELRDAAGIACIEQAGQGAMGIHYVNGALLMDPALDALRPEALVYAPGRDGRLALVGVEYLVFQQAWDALHAQPPTLFGHPFHLVREPNRYGVPAFYELHLWVWRRNPGGLFNDWNPAVHCP